MKKTIASIIILMTFLLIFASCNTAANGGGNENGTVTAASSETTALTPENIGEYKIVRAENADVGVITCTQILMKAVNAKFGTDVRLADDWVKRGTTPDSATKEILVGVTNRDESKNLYASLDTMAYAVKVDGNKIVILAKSNSLLPDAIDYFIKTYVDSSDGSALSLPAGLSYVSATYESLCIVNAKKTEYTIIRPEDASQTLIDVTISLADTIESLTGVRPALSTDWLAKGAQADPSAKEILVGMTNRAESSAAVEGMSYAGYAFKPDGAKIVLAGVSDAGTKVAVDAFAAQCKLEVTAKTDGYADLFILGGTSAVGVREGWRDDVPLYDGGTVDAVIDSADDAYTVYVKSTGENEYKTYLTKLETAGYKKYTSIDMSGNLYATYENGSTLINAYYTPHNKVTHIVVEPLTALPGLEADNKYTAVTTPLFIQVGLKYAEWDCGMSYVLRSSDGRFIIIDGGAGEDGESAALYKILTENNKLSGNPVIAAWIFTHAHPDHYNNFINFTIEYSTKVTLENVIFNFPSASVYKASGENRAGGIDSVEKSARSYAGVKIIQARSGQVYYYGDMKIDMLYTQDDLYPAEMTVFNDSSLAFRITVAGQKIMILGDVYHNASNELVARYGTDLKADIVQVAHHGYEGATPKLYDMIDPAVAVCPAPSYRYNTLIQREANKHLLFELHVKDFINGGLGTDVLELPYTPKDNPPPKQLTDAS